MTQPKRDLLSQWFEQVWNQGRREAVAELLAPDAVFHEDSVDVRGPEGFYPFFDRMTATFSDIHVQIEATMEDGDKICVRWSFTGKHTGDGLGVAPTGKTIRTTGISIVRVADGRLAEGWQNWDMLGMLQQIEGAPKSATYVGA